MLAEAHRLCPSRPERAPSGLAYRGAVGSKLGAEAGSGMLGAGAGEAGWRDRACRGGRGRSRGRDCVYNTAQLGEPVAMALEPLMVSHRASGIGTPAGATLALSERDRHRPKATRNTSCSQRKKQQVRLLTRKHVTASTEGRRDDASSHT